MFTESWKETHTHIHTQRSIVIHFLLLVLFSSLETTFHLWSDYFIFPYSHCFHLITPWLFLLGLQRHEFEVSFFLGLTSTLPILVPFLGTPPPIVSLNMISVEWVAPKDPLRVNQEADIIIAPVLGNYKPKSLICPSFIRCQAPAMYEWSFRS